MYEMNGLAGTLAGMKEDAMEAAKLGGGVVLGVSIASYLDKKLKGDDGKGILGDLDSAGTARAWAKWVRPLIPLAVGLGLFSKLRGQYPALAGANGLGMMGYGLGSLVKSALNSADQSAGASYVALGAVDTYESNILAGLGAADYSINRYLSPSLNGYSRYPGAPTFVQTLQGAPTQIQSLQGAPTSIESLNGLSATLM
jgi:hypothetical protein